MKHEDDENVVVLPDVYTPYAIARKVLSFVKDGHEGVVRVRGLIAFVTVDTEEGRTGVVPFSSTVSLADMGLVNMAASTMSVQYMTAATTVVPAKETPPDEGA